MNNLPVVQPKETTSSVAATTFDFGGLAITSITIDGAIWFIAKEVCTALGYLNVSQAIEQHVRPWNKKTLTESDSIFVNIRSIFTNNKTRHFAIINESGLYSLILRSRKPEAERFERWVTEEVLPSIRKTGKFSLQPNNHSLILQEQFALLVKQFLRLEDTIVKAQLEANTKGVTSGRPTLDGLIRPQIALDNARYYILTLGIYDDELKTRTISNNAIYTEIVNLTLNSLPERFYSVPFNDILDRNYVRRLILARKRTLGIKPLRHIKTINQAYERAYLH